VKIEPQPESYELTLTTRHLHLNSLFCMTASGLADTTHIHKKIIQKLCRLLQLCKRYSDQILPLLNMIFCNLNALGPAYLQHE